MNYRRILGFVIIAVIGVFAWIKINPSKNESPLEFSPEDRASSRAQEKQVPRNGQAIGEAESTYSDIELTEEEAAAKPDGIDQRSWLANVFLHRANVKEKNGDVEFYGKIIDQDGLPIEGVEIEALSRQYVESIKEQAEFGGGKVISKSIETSTDSAGLFSISGFRGRILRLQSIRKQGYSPPSKLPAFSYSPNYSVQHHPDVTAPVIISMWKEGITEPLIKYFWRRRVVPDGGGHAFDLKNTRSVDDEKNGDLKISVFADYAAGKPTTDYPWVVKVESQAGGIQVSKDPYAYHAPEVGYQSNLTWSSDEIEGKWTRDLNQTIYIKGQDGNYYASVKLSVKIFHTNSASITMDLLLNPSGSRNLKFDPSKKIN